MRISRAAAGFVAGSILLAGGWAAADAGPAGFTAVLAPAGPQADRSCQEGFEFFCSRLDGREADHVDGHAERLLEAGDFEEALTAAHAVGDDTLQKQYQGYVVPDSFTHGTSEQRMRWFTKGFETGDLSGGDTFNIGYDEL